MNVAPTTVAPPAPSGDRDERPAAGPFDALLRSTEARGPAARPGPGRAGDGGPTAPDARRQGVGDETAATATPLASGDEQDGTPAGPGHVGPRDPGLHGRLRAAAVGAALPQHVLPLGQVLAEVEAGEGGAPTTGSDGHASAGTEVVAEIDTGTTSDAVASTADLDAVAAEASMAVEGATTRPAGEDGAAEGSHDPSTPTAGATPLRGAVPDVGDVPGDAAVQDPAAPLADGTEEGGHDTPAADRQAPDTASAGAVAGTGAVAPASARAAGPTPRAAAAALAMEETSPRPPPAQVAPATVDVTEAADGRPPRPVVEPAVPVDPAAGAADQVDGLLRVPETSTRAAVGRGTGLAASVAARVEAAVAALEHTPPPQDVRIEVDGLVLQVRLRGEVVRVQGEQLPSGWDADLAERLGAQGYELDGRADGRERREGREEPNVAGDQVAHPHGADRDADPATAARSATDGLRL